MRSVLVSFDGLETSCLPVAEAVVNERDLRNRLESLWRIPSELQQIVWNGVRVADGTLLNVAGESFHTAAIKLRGGALKGGKGGFGSMLRSIGAKAAQRRNGGLLTCLAA
ncbi:hypothetical protein SARC_00048 [Sphaeroforma arctica JP610]|uniref:Uncharacterized protein n=1 Tax=Sphaeroforma arctica JP610 TaxID=667725 RepID=A0A0L0GFE1_9EUKA|nr:hypothetical protein SARC_00048 [Sphaeroforma arctica JP610]KNC87790.1 hypothetical protein SARC_00048 [Sphaeroforma arctica JP610]|eukprot:XP_014161692.1 hypothetical protein SARC_00048 [Sphaeroforma arctica JP610]